MNQNKNKQNKSQNKAITQSNTKVNPVKKSEPIQTNYLKVFSPVIAIFLVTTYLYVNRTGQITGKILVDSDIPSPLSDVKITLDGKEINNKTPEFNLTGIKSGEHTISFEKNGFEKLEQKITLEKGEIEEVSVRLTQIKEKESISKGSPLIVFQDNLGSLNLLSNTNVKTKLDLTIPTLDSVFSVKDKIYVLDSSNSKLHSIEINNIKNIKSLDFEINSKPNIFSLSNQKDRAFIVLSNKSNISTVNLDSFIISKSEEESLKDFGQIKAINNIIDSNKVFLSGINKVGIFNPLAKTSESINVENVSASNIGYFKYHSLLLDDVSKSLTVVNILTKESKKLELNFVPVDVISTSNSIIVVSKDSIYKFNIDNHSFEEISKTKLNNIVDVNYSSLENKLYLIENGNKNISVFDLNKNEFLKDPLIIDNYTKIKFIE